MTAIAETNRKADRERRDKDPADQNSTERSREPTEWSQQPPGAGSQELKGRSQEEGARRKELESSQKSEGGRGEVENSSNEVRTPAGDVAGLAEPGPESGDTEAATEAPGAGTISADNGEPHVDEAAESAFLAEARDRGEVVPKPSSVEPVEEIDPKSLPKLDDLVAKIPANVRDVLEDLFRARFVSVKRIPKKALK